MSERTQPTKRKRPAPPAKSKAAKAAKKVNKVKPINAEAAQARELNWTMGDSDIREMFPNGILHQCRHNQCWHWTARRPPECKPRPDIDVHWLRYNPRTSGFDSLPPHLRTPDRAGSWVCLCLESDWGAILDVHPILAEFETDGLDFWN